MRAWAVAVAICAVSCFPDRPTNEVVDAPPAASQVAGYAQQLLGTAEDRRAVGVVWMRGPCLVGVDDRQGVCKLGAYYTPTAWTDPMIYLVRGGTVAGSALVHELLHHHFAMAGVADEGHDSPRWAEVGPISESAWWRIECPALYSPDECVGPDAPSPFD